MAKDSKLENIAKATKKLIGVSIKELNETLLDKLGKPLINFTVDTSVPFKQAKRIFKKQFFSQLIETHYGNISEVAEFTDVDRRTIHRIVKELGINVKKLRSELLNPDHYKKMIVGERVKDALDEYKNVIKEETLQKAYEKVTDFSKEILDEIPTKKLTLKEAEDEFEKRYLMKALEENGHNISVTAKKIGIRYETLIRKMKVLGIE
tara:strand:- start:2273 stop:2893 length:621 start_codon:yes stop_codon:yes gene_type:complete